MEKLILKGRRNASVIALLAIVLSVVVPALSFYKYSVEGLDYEAGTVLTASVVRLGLLFVLLFFSTKKGKNWAKLILASWYFISAITGLLSSLGTLNIIQLSIAFIYFVMAFSLVLSKSINAFFKFRRGEIDLDQIEEEKK